MSKFAHPEMGKVRDTSASQNLSKPETYIVEDATEPNATSQTVDDRLLQFDAQSANVPADTEYKLPKKKISETLEKLIFIGRLSSEVSISDIVFELSSLTNKEHNEIVHMMYGFDDPADLFTIRVLTLANSLRKIDGVLIDDIEIDGEFESAFHKRMSVIDHLQLSVVEKLYDAYEELVKEEEGSANKNEEIKNS